MAVCKQSEIITDNNGCKWISYSPSTKHCYGFTECNGIQNYNDYISSQVECEMNNILKDRDNCFHLSVDDCDCDVVFYCNLICDDEGNTGEYDAETETCCCV